MVDDSKEQPSAPKGQGSEQPLHTRLDLASEPSGVRWGRAHAADVLDKWEVSESIIDSALLVISELLTDAVKHARRVSSAPVRCSLLLWLNSRGLTVAVYDVDTRPPALRPASLEAEGGRGLVIVEENSEEWGYTYPSPDSGKLVWARLTATPALPVRSSDVPFDPPALVVMSA